MIEEQRDKIMSQWDYWRKRIADGDTSSGPRDWFESILEATNDKTNQAMRIIRKLRKERQEFKDNLQVCENELEFLGKKLDELLIVAKRLDE